MRSGWYRLNDRLWVFPAAACLDERSSAYGGQADRPERLRVGHFRRAVAPASLATAHDQLQRSTVYGWGPCMQHLKEPYTDMSLKTCG